MARIEQVEPTTVKRWVERARSQAEKADKDLIKNVTTDAVEMDELYSFAGSKQETESEQDQAGRQWADCAMARQSRLLLEVVVGPRVLDTAAASVQGAAGRLARDCRPLWCSDGLKNYIEALLSVFHVVLYYLRTGSRGRPRKMGRVAHPLLQYGQIRKKHVGRRLVSITKRIIFGVEELIPLAKISTSLLERLNGTMRLHVSPIRRRTRTFAKLKHTLSTHVQLFKAYYNFGTPYGNFEVTAAL